MQPLDRVAKVLFKVLELMNDNPDTKTSMKALRTRLSCIPTHSSRQGNVIFVHDALLLSGAGIDMFRYVNNMLPKNY